MRTQMSAGGSEVSLILGFAIGALGVALGGVAVGVGAVATGVSVAGLLASVGFSKLAQAVRNSARPTNAMRFRRPKTGFVFI